MTTEYVVERIDEKTEVDGVPYYFIKWKGWPEESNTWEPIKNLDGCPGLLKKFEKEHAKKSKSRTQGGERFKEEVEPQDVDEAITDTVDHMKSYGILSKWPADKEPLSVEGVIFVDGRLTYVVKRKPSPRSAGLTRANANLVYADSFRLVYPHLVIKFYENRTCWSGNSKPEEENAKVAAQNTVFHQNVGSRRGKMVANHMDCKLREMYDERKDMNKAIKQEVKDTEDPVIEDDEAMEEEEEEVQEVNDKLNDEDNFGLPNNLDHNSSDDSMSGSEPELEEIDVDCKQNECSWKREVAATTTQVSSDDDESWNWKRGIKKENHSVDDNDDGEISDY